MAVLIQWDPGIPGIPQSPTRLPPVSEIVAQIVISRFVLFSPRFTEYLGDCPKEKVSLLPWRSLLPFIAKLINAFASAAWWANYS